MHRTDTLWAMAATIALGHLFAESFSDPTGVLWALCKDSTNVKHLQLAQAYENVPMEQIAEWAEDLTQHIYDSYHKSFPVMLMALAKQSEGLRPDQYIDYTHPPDLVVPLDAVSGVDPNAEFAIQLQGTDTVRTFHNEPLMRKFLIDLEIATHPDDDTMPGHLTTAELLRMGHFDLVKGTLWEGKA